MIVIEIRRFVERVRKVNLDVVIVMIWKVYFEKFVEVREYY